ncbi:AMP-binding protein [Millisia brevis]|uniref:AMP-binding protein n=1 Tax=Millisia brevis TaxID=264148 RepID=UPI000AB6C014|nr:AMP-binding protein [Millisia brevis]
MTSKPFEENRTGEEATSERRPAEPWWRPITGADFGRHIPDSFNIARACVDLPHPHDTALIVDTAGVSTTHTFGDVASLSRRVAGALGELGLAVGDRVAVMIPQGVEVLAAHLGAFRAGLVTVPLSVKFGAEAVGHRLRDSGARVLIIDAAIHHRIADELVDIPDLAATVLVGEPDMSSGPTGFEPPGFGRLRFDALLASAPEYHGTADTTPDSPAIIIYTSGTTGSPKGAVHGHRALAAHLPGVRIAFDDAPQPDDVFWTPADWAWIGGLFDVLFPALALGCPVVASPDPFTPQGAIDLMRRHRVTLAFIPPTALKHMRGADLPPSADQLVLRMIATGGESLGSALPNWVNATLGVPINEFYGQTEINMTVGTSRSQWTPAPESMGRAFPGFTVAILDPDSRPVPAGEVGEICVAADNPGQFLEYWRQPEKTADKRRDGWIHTGDLGSSDAAGNLWYRGRIDDVISSSGYRIGPGEIEECLLGHPRVAMAGVVGVPDALRGESIQAFVVLTESPGGESDTDRDLIAGQLQVRVKQKLAFYQYPRVIRFLDELPLTTTGKILRRELRRLAGAADA